MTLLNQYPVRIVSVDEFQEHRRERYQDPALVRAEPWLQWQLGSYSGFMWECPGCGGAYWGELGQQPVGGWEHPQWVNRGSITKPTLEPSLGCGAWHRGECHDGHWWLRDGMLVRA